MDNRRLFRKPEQIIADGTSVNENPAAVFKGLGMTASSARLLLDYKYKFPAVYQTILKLLFGLGYGAGLRHIRIELGADVNALSGAEPCTMHEVDETADVTCCTGFMLAADARRINPSVSVELIRLGDPGWVSAAFAEGKEAGYAARYQWYLESIKAAYAKYGLTLDCISPDVCGADQPDTEWLLYFAEHLKQEEDSPYDFSNIRLAVYDQNSSGTASQELLKNEQLCNIIDAIGLHHASRAGASAMELYNDHQKEIWLSDGLTPSNIPTLSCRVDGCGMAGRNGAVDMARRIINSYASSRTTLYSFRTAVNACYDGDGGLITANSPWSGHFSVNIGFWIAAHFTRFSKPGWRFVNTACAVENENGGGSCMTLVSPDKRHLTMHLTNNTNSPRSCLIVFRNLPRLAETVNLIETSGSADAEHIDQNWFRLIQQIHLHTVDGEAAFPVVVKAHSVLTLTTMDASEICGTEELHIKIPEQRRLPLPRFDRFFYERKNPIPLYMADQGGAFKVITAAREGYLEQQATAPPVSYSSRSTPEPFTIMGDDLWMNYQGIAEAEFASDAPDNYIGIGIRCNSLPVSTEDPLLSGFSLRLYADGKWEFRYIDELLMNDVIPDFQYDGRHKIGISAIGTLILCFADGHSLHEIKMDDRPIVRTGRMCLQSGYYRNRFYKTSVQPVPSFFSVYPTCYRLDCLSPWVQYLEDAEGVWTLRGLADYHFYHRTCAEGETGSVMEIRFYGTGISLVGKIDRAYAAFWIDDMLYSDRYEIVKCTYRESFFLLDSLREGWHTLRMEILDGIVEFDSFEIPTSDIRAEYNPSHLPPDPQAAEESEKSRSFRLSKAAVPIAGAAAAGVAAAFMIGKMIKKKKK